MSPVLAQDSYSPTVKSDARIAAFFDMDRTLLRCNTGTRWLQFMRRRGEISVWKTLRAIGWLARYKLSILDMEAVTALAVQDVRGGSEADMIETTRRWLEQEILQEVAPLALEAIEFHRRQGHLLAILSSSTRYVTEPLAAHLGIEHVLCTRFVVDEGRFAGTHVRPACYGEGKVHWAEAFARQHHIDLDASWFYTDSHTDLPMLRRVGVRRVINPDMRLRLTAAREGWEVHSW